MGQSKCVLVGVIHSFLGLAETVNLSVKFLNSRRKNEIESIERLGGLGKFGSCFWHILLTLQNKKKWENYMKRKTETACDKKGSDGNEANNTACTEII